MILLTDASLLTFQLFRLSLTADCVFCIAAAAVKLDSDMSSVSRHQPSTPAARDNTDDNDDDHNDDYDGYEYDNDMNTTRPPPPIIAQVRLADITPPDITPWARTPSQWQGRTKPQDITPCRIRTQCTMSFLSRVSILLLTRDIDIVILSVCLSVRLSVCLSVTRWYCMKTA